MYHPCMSFYGDRMLKPTNESSGLDGRRRNAEGEIDRKHGNTLVRTLREIYGHDFAADCRADMKLSTLLWENGVDSLSQYLKRNR
jgi:hypothetical protein